MKNIKMLAIGSMIACCTLVGAISVHANDPWYNLGYAIGSSIGNSPGVDDKDYYCNPSYNFNNMRRVLIIAQVPQQYAQYISDPYIPNEYVEFAKDALKDTMIVSNVNDAERDFNALGLKFNTQDEYTKAFGDYVASHYDGILIVNIYAYSQNGSYGNVFMDFTLKDNYAINTLMYYKDMRMNAPRSNKVGMIKRITGAFQNKIKKARK